MIYLATGLPGNYKTLSVVKLIRDEYKDRQVYTNITFTPEGLALMANVHVVADDELADWSGFPDGSLIVIDEAQKIWPTRHASKPVPSGVEQLAQHRHRGFDFVIITQDPALIDTWVRKFVQQHWHFDRPFGSPFAFKYVYEGLMEKPTVETKSSTFVGESKKIFPDKSIYPLYKSATIHTVKFSLPTKAKIAIALAVVSIVAIGYGGRNFYKQFWDVGGSSEKTKSAVAKVGKDLGLRSADARSGGEVITAEDLRRALKISRECVVAGIVKVSANERVMLQCADGGFYSLEDLKWYGGFDWDAVHGRVLLHTGHVIHRGFLPDSMPQRMKEDKK